MNIFIKNLYKLPGGYFTEYSVDRTNGINNKKFVPDSKDFYSNQQPKLGKNPNNQMAINHLCIF